MRATKGYKAPGVVLAPSGWLRLARAAESARAFAYAPYSDYAVGAAILTTRGVVAGCNVENAAYPLCICAEAAATTAAVAQGRTRWRAIAVATAGPEPGAPCGACRQILMEFATSALPVGLVVGGKVVRKVTLGDLLPYAFSSKMLRGG